MDTLIMADPNQMIMTPIYIGESLGFFKEEGLVIKYNKFSSGRDCINSVLSGESDFSGSTEFPIAKNIYNGVDLKILTSIYRSNNNDLFLGKSSSGIFSISDIKDKRIGLTFNTNSDYILSLILLELGLEITDIIKVDIDPMDMVEAMVNNAVDGVITWNPYTFDIIESYKDNDIFIYNSQSYTALSVLAASSSSLEKNRSSYSKLLKALIKAEIYIFKNREKSLDLVVKYLNLEKNSRLIKQWEDQVFIIGIDNLLVYSIKNEYDWVMDNSVKREYYPISNSIDSSILLNIRPSSITYNNGYR